MKAYKNLLLTLAALFLIEGCGVFIFNPQKEFTDDPALAPYAREDIRFSTSDGVTLHGWLFRGRASSGLIVFLHGYQDNISTQARNAVWLVDAGYDVFAFDYRGHGRSEGSPTVDGVNIDALGAIDAAFRLPGVNTARVFVLGQSMGGAIAVWATANTPHKDRITALILDAPFSDYRAIARESLDKSPLKWPLKYLAFVLGDSYSPASWISKVSPVPVLIVHGTGDETIAPYHAKVLYDAAVEPKELWMIKDKGHPHALSDVETRRALVEYMEKTGGRRP